VAPRLRAKHLVARGDTEMGDILWFDRSNDTIKTVARREP
jgi:hypothetical protein